MTAKNTGHSCPSAPCAPGATLLGVLGADGKIHNMRTAMIVDQDFVDNACTKGPPEGRMRFSASCQSGQCAQWDDGKCGVIERVLKRLAPATETSPKKHLQPCVIRNDCRWFSQRGAPACNACQKVVTNLGLVTEDA